MATQAKERKRLIDHSREQIEDSSTNKNLPDFRSDIKSQG